MTSIFLLRGRLSLGPVRGKIQDESGSVSVQRDLPVSPPPHFFSSQPLILLHHAAHAHTANHQTNGAHAGQISLMVQHRQGCSSRGRLQFKDLPREREDDAMAKVTRNTTFPKMRDG